LIGTEQINLGDTVKLISTADLFIIKDITSDSSGENIKFIGYYILDDDDDKQHHHHSQISININQIGGKNYTRFPSIQHDEITRHKIDMNEREKIFSSQMNEYFRSLLPKEFKY